MLNVRFVLGQGARDKGRDNTGRKALQKRDEKQREESCCTLAGEQRRLLSDVPDKPVPQFRRIQRRQRHPVHRHLQAAVKAVTRAVECPGKGSEKAVK